jgi:hypothetical protein
LNEIDDGHRVIYQRKVNGLSSEQKAALDELINRMKIAGCKDPFLWAFSEITEDIPQFGRFLVLKNLFEIAVDVDRTIEYAEVFANDYTALEEKVLQVVDKALLKQYLKAYNRGMIGQFIELIDEGNDDCEKDNVDWVLLKTDSERNHTGQIINGLHENFLEFKMELE